MIIVGIVNLFHTPFVSLAGGRVRVVLCPDSFKGSADSTAVAEAMASGVRSVRPDARIEMRPMADGGEGTADVVVRSLGGEWRQVVVHAPNGECIEAHWGWLASRRLAVVEVATACGLDLLPAEARDPWRLDTHGVGELIRAALDEGAEQILVGLGGSGTNDAGCGMLAALGVRFLDRQGHHLPPDPASLARLERVDFSGIDARLQEVSMVMLTDVDNPLLGSDGATATFGPQKGLATQDLKEMDDRLKAISDKLAAGRPLRCAKDKPGMGAAGGLGFAFGAVLGAERQVGSRYIAELVSLDDAIAAADLVITGEGRLDEQTGRGKVVAEVVRLAQESGRPVLAIAGDVIASIEETRQMGLWGAYCLRSEGQSVDSAMANSRTLIVQRTAEAVRDWLAADGK